MVSFGDDPMAERVLVNFLDETGRFGVLLLFFFFSFLTSWLKDLSPPQ